MRRLPPAISPSHWRPMCTMAGSKQARCIHRSASSVRASALAAMSVREAITILQGMRLADQTKGKRPRVVTPNLGQIMSGLGEAAQFFFVGSEGKAHLEQARLFLETSVHALCGRAHYQCANGPFAGGNRGMRGQPWRCGRFFECGCPFSPGPGGSTWQSDFRGFA